MPRPLYGLLSKKFSQTVNRRMVKINLKASITMITSTSQIAKTKMVMHCILYRANLSVVRTILLMTDFFSAYHKYSILERSG
jgi:hypothetical protein